MGFASTAVIWLGLCFAGITKTMQFCAKNALRVFLISILVFPIALAGQNTHFPKQNSSASAKDMESEESSQVEADRDDAGASCQDTGCPGAYASYSSDSAILRVALNSHPRSAHLLDCSHFVHSVYERAGLPYSYASSSDLYFGINNFRRVSVPQAGDLAVWRGHVGIVVDPAERSFLSVLHTGPSIDNYDSRYWKHRGKPRFFHYAKLAPASRSSDTVHRASLTRIEPEDAAADTLAVAVASDDAVQNTAPDFDASAVVAEPPASLAWGAKFHSARPTAAEIHVALTEAGTRLETGFRGLDLFSLNYPVVVFDNFEVMQVHLAKNSGWADIKVDEVMLLARGKVQPHNGVGIERWMLRRTGKKSWELSQPTQGLYLPQQAAERVVSHELAQLTETNSRAAGTTRQKAELARLLNILFTK